MGTRQVYRCLSYNRLAENRKTEKFRDPGNENTSRVGYGRGVRLRTFGLMVANE